MSVRLNHDKYSLPNNYNSQCIFDSINKWPLTFRITKFLPILKSIVLTMDTIINTMSQMISEPGYCY